MLLEQRSQDPHVLPRYIEQCCFLFTQYKKEDTLPFLQKKLWWRFHPKVNAHLPLPFTHSINTTHMYVSLAFSPMHAFIQMEMCFSLLPRDIYWTWHYKEPFLHITNIDHLYDSGRLRWWFGPKPSKHVHFQSNYLKTAHLQGHTHQSNILTGWKSKKLQSLR